MPAKASKSSSAGERLTIATPGGSVSALLRSGGKSAPILVLAHGAGSDMNAPFLGGFASGVADAGVGCLRFNFLYKEAGRRAPDRPAVLLATWRAVFERASELGGPLWVGGKSMGGRLASMAVADGMSAAGLVLLGYPLHAPGKPERLRDEHLYDIKVPMLFIQGTKDTLARYDLLENVIAKLGKRATLHAIDGGDHSFRVRGPKVDDYDLGQDLAAIAARFLLEPKE